MYTYTHSVIGSLVYSYIKYAEQQEKQAKKQKVNGELVNNSDKIKNIEDGQDDNPPIPPHIK